MNSKHNRSSKESLVESRPTLSIVSTKRKPQGRDELNFAEFPIAAITDRSDPSVKTLYFGDTIFDRESGALLPRKLTITAADAFGLPGPKDEEVILALLQITAEKKCESKQINFTRLELLNRLGWSPTGQSYRRLQDALNRWTGVTLCYENSWRDRSTNSWVTETVHMLERVRLVDSSTLSKGEEGSFVIWGDVVFRSFQSGNLKTLDHDFYRSLRLSISRRLYRFLDKRFYHGDNKSFDLRRLAFENIGLSRNTPTGDLKRKINEAYDELIAGGFLEATPVEKRFTKVKAKEWEVHFTRAKVEVLSAEEPPVDNSLLGRLVSFGVSRNKALELIEMSPQELIEEKLEIAEWLKQKNDARVSKNAAGYLIRSIEDAFSVPTDFQTVKEKEELERRALEEKRVGKAREKKRTERQRQREERQEALIAEFWAEVSEERKEEILTLEIQKVSPLKREMIERGGPGAGALIEALLRDYALEAIANG
jgi:plasmid replication initiation protein